MEQRKTTPTVKPLSSKEAQEIFDDLRADGFDMQITKRDYSNIAQCSISTVDHYMAKGYGLPPYRKIGNKRNAKVLFSLRDVSEFLASQTVVTA